MIVVWFLLTMPRVCLQFVIVVLPDYTDFLFLTKSCHISVSTFSGQFRIDSKVCFNLFWPICLLKALKLIWLFVNQRR